MEGDGEQDRATRVVQECCFPGPRTGPLHSALSPEQTLPDEDSSPAEEGGAGRRGRG